MKVSHKTKSGRHDGCSNNGVKEHCRNVNSNYKFIVVNVPKR